MKKITLLLVIFIGLSNLEINSQDLKLWYNSPASVWEEALPLGNSRLGAMVYGIPQREEIQLNEETIWGGSPHRNDNPKALGALPEVQKLIFDEKYEDADKLINDTFFGGPHGMPYLTAGSVILNFENHQNYQNYYRELDLNKAVALTRYKVDDVTYTRELFSSFADDLIIMRISADKMNSLNFSVLYQNPLENTVSIDGAKLILNGKGTDHEGISGKVVFEIQTEIKSKDGKVEANDNSIHVSNASEAIIYISIGTNFSDWNNLENDPKEIASKMLEAGLKEEYKSALERHISTYVSQFNKFKLDLGVNDNNKNLTTTERIKDFKNSQDPSLVTLLAQFGRYLLISSSQPGGQPANLQGIWNNSVNPAWDSKYTININAEMNYWPAEVTNLSDNHHPLFQMIEDLSNSGRETARTMYGAEGWVAHHNTDIWRITGPVDFAAAGMWPTGGAWLCQHIWEHWLYTGDKEFLSKYFHVLKGASDFFLSTLIEHPDNGWRVVSPSVSPEIGPVTAGTTMDNQLVFDLFSNTAMANDLLGMSSAYSNKLREMINKLPPMQIGKYSQLQEWLQDVDDPKNEHRHVSHLYGLYPGNQISPYSTPELFEGAKQSLIYRGDQATGWSIGWKVNLWARLLDGEHAYKIIQNMLTLAGSGDQRGGRTYPNLFTAHPPFQIDGNFGLTAGVAEMLVQSHDQAVHLLPALPKLWAKGSVSGIMARGGFEIDMNWDDEIIEKAEITSKLGGNLRIRSYVPLKGAGLTKAKGNNQNILFRKTQVKDPIINDNFNHGENITRTVFEYDLLTEPGKKYLISRM